MVRFGLVLVGMVPTTSLFLALISSEPSWSFQINGNHLALRSRGRRTRPTVVVDGRRLTPTPSSSSSSSSLSLWSEESAVIDVVASSSSLWSALAFVVVFRVGAALAVVGQPRLPALRERTVDGGGGRIAVGSRVVRLRTSTRARVRVFYPCRDDASIPFAPYCTDGRATSDGMAALVGFRRVGWSFLLAHLADASSGCRENAAHLVVERPTTTLPLLAYSHGYGGNMDMAAYFLRAVAAEGVVVAAVEHTDGTASSTVSEDGTRSDFSPFADGDGRASLLLRAEELTAAAREIGRTFGTDGLCYGGHSYGCPTAILAAAAATNDDDLEVDGLVLHDPALSMGFGLLPDDDDVDVSSVSYTSDEYDRAGVRFGDVTLHVRGAFHGNFVDAPLWAPAWVMRTLSLVIPAAGPVDPVRAHQSLARSAAWFAKNTERSAEGLAKVDEELFEIVAR